MPDFPSPRWVCLKSPQGKLLARFDPTRGILEFVQRGGEPLLFDLAQIVHDLQHPNAQSPPTKTMLNLNPSPPPVG